MRSRLSIFRIVAIASVVAGAPACGDAPSSDAVAPVASTSPSDANGIVDRIQTEHRAPSAVAFAPLRDLAAPAETSPLGVGTIAAMSTAGDALHLSLAESEDAAHAHLRATLPAYADGATHLEDRASGVAVDLRLEGASPVAASLARGFVVHPRGLRGEADLVHSVSARAVEDFARFDRAPSHEALAYSLDLTNVAGLRLVAGSLELLDANGAPRLRAAPPYVIGSDGSRRDATLSIEGCAYDASPAAPWGRAVTAPGARTCRLVVSWEGRGVTYPALVDPSWSSAGSGMQHARMGHAAVSINVATSVTDAPHYVVLVSGGYDSFSGTVLQSAEMYDPATGTWAGAGAMKGGRAFHTMTTNAENLAISMFTVIEPGKALVAGGMTASGVPLATAEIYDVVSGAWSSIAPMKVPRARHAAAGLNGLQVVVVGGDGAAGTVNATSETYDPWSGTWTLSTTNMSQGRTNFALVGFNATQYKFGSSTPCRLVVAGGQTLGGGMVTTFEEFEVGASGGVWKPTLVTMQYPVYGHTGTALTLANGKRVAAFAGGINAAGSTTRYVQLFDKDALAIAGLGVLQSDAAYHAAVATTASRMVLVGGETNVGTPNNAMVYRATSNVFDAATGWPVGYPVSFGSFAAARTLTTATRMSNGKFLVVGGWALPGISLSDAVVYTP